MARFGSGVWGVAGALALAGSAADAGQVAGGGEPPAAASAPTAPFKIGDGLYYVGNDDNAVYLIVTRAGLILLDGGTTATGRLVPAKIRALGFDPATIKVLLVTHAHEDHAGGLATLKQVAARDSVFYASNLDGAVIASGGRTDPYLPNDPKYQFEPVKPDAILTDGQRITLGEMTITAHLTPGHTPGCTSYSFATKVAGKVRQVLAPCSWAMLPGFKVGKVESYPGITADYERSFAVWRSLPCDVFISSTHQFFNFRAKKAALLAGNPEAFVDPKGCSKFFADSQAAFYAELRRQNP